jgi:integrase
VSPAASLAAAPARRPLPREFGHVLAGVVLDGPAARLAAMLDPAFLAEAGWDPASRVLSLPAGHPLLGRALCRADGCPATAHGATAGGLCWSCFARLRRAGMSAEQIAAAPRVPAAPARPAGCLVPGCERMSPGGRQGQRTGLCVAHSRRFRRIPGMTMERFLADPAVRPLAALGPCRVAACSRRAESEHGYCPTHYARWRSTVTAAPGTDQRRWELTEPAVSEGGQVSLRGLAPLVVVQVLFGIWQRTRGGAKITDVSLRGVCDTLRRQQSASIADCPAAAVRAGRPARALLAALARHVRHGLADPAAEQDSDVWDLAVFGHHGRLSFTGISQPWLARAAKAWAAGELPRHRGRGASKVREKINALARLSESLRARGDHGMTPASLGRPDAEAFLARLAYLESACTISRYHRTVICRDVRAALAGIRAIGLTRPGQAAAGLPGDFMIGRGDIPADPERGEPGRDLPPEIMAVLCASLDSLQPAEARTAVQIAIDTGRRPEDILALPLNCLARDAGGGAVLIYDNAKAGRAGRRLPIGQATAAVILAQQDRVRDRFPATPASELKLLPGPRRNPGGRRAISIDMLDQRHREWVDSLGVLRARDGAVFDKARATPYAYRHSYAQRHADAGVPIDVLAQLMDHRDLNATRGYYRVGEDRRREAVDKVTAFSFDRHGNRIWRDAAALLASEHARYAVGEVAVPYGRCAEPSNVAAGGGACPIRFRCAGCDHFRTDVSHLPDLTAYLDDLLQTRERLAAAIDGVDEWARADATPAEQEIIRIRALITRIRGDITQLTDAERAQVDQAVTVVRRHRAVSLGMPAIRPAAPAAGAAR